MFSKRNLVLGLITAFIVLGGALRFYDLGEQSLWMDEGYSINASQAVLERGLPVMDSGEWYKKSQADVYSIAASMGIFGFDAFNPWSARLPAALFGTLSIAAICILARRLSSSDAVMVCSAFLMAFATWEIAWSRQARGYAGMQLFVLLSAYFLTAWFQEKKHTHLVTSLLCLGVSALFHPSSLVMLIPLGVLLIADAVKRNGIHSHKSNLISFAGAAIAVACFFVLAPEASIFKFTDIPITYLWGTYPLLMCCAVGVVIWSFFSKKDAYEIWAIASAVALPVIFLSVYHHAMERRYLLPVFPFILILAALFSAKAISRFNIKKDALAIAASLVMVGVLGYMNLTFMPRSTYALEQGSPQPDFENAYAYINERRNPDDLLLSAYAHLNKIYTGESGQWLAIGLRGGTQDVEEAILRGHDFYTDAPAIGTLEDINKIMTSRSGYVLIDTLSYMRLGKDKIRAIVENKKETVYQSGDLNTRIFIYKF